MLINLLELLRGYHLNGLWQFWILTQIRAIATGAHPTVVQALAKAMPVVERANDLRRRYDQVRGKHIGSDEAQVLARQIGKLVGSVYGALDACAQAGQDHADEAARLLEAAFPAGLGAHLQASHVAQVSHNEALLRLLRLPEHAEVCAWTRIDRTRDALEVLCPKFAQATGAVRPVSASDVAQAELLGENAVMTVIAAIIAAYDDGVESERRVRNELLRPLTVANGELRDVYQAQARKREQAAVCADPGKQKLDTGSAGGGTVAEGTGAKTSADTVGGPVPTTASGGAAAPMNATGGSTSPANTTGAASPANMAGAVSPADVAGGASRGASGAAPTTGGSSSATPAAGEGASGGGRPAETPAASGPASPDPLDDSAPSDIPSDFQQETIPAPTMSVDELERARASR